MGQSEESDLAHIRSARQGLGKEVDPKTVLIECAKAGYRTMSQDRRVLRTMPKAPVEVDCKLQSMAPVS